MHASGKRLTGLSRLVVFALTSLVGGGCDLHTKRWAESALSTVPGESIMVADPWLELSLAYNRGTAFSFVRDLGDARWVFGVVALVVVGLLVLNVLRSHGDRLEIAALGAIAGGAIGNGIDRMFALASSDGTGVIDFIRINYPWGGSWPTFNVADVLIAVGVALFVWRRWRATPDPTPSVA